MAVYFECGFYRTNIFEGQAKYHSSKKHERFLFFKEQFNACQIDIEEDHFHRKAADLTKFVRKKKWLAKYREIYCKTFSSKTWSLLSFADKKLHTLKNCLECQKKFPHEQSIFPSLGNQHQKPVLKDITNTEGTSNMAATVNFGVNSKDMVKSAESLVNSAEKVWNKLYNTPLSDVLPQVPSLNLKKKMSKDERRKNIRNINKKFKEGIEKSWQADGRDVVNLYGNRMSCSQYGKQRACLFMESKEEAVKRTSKRKTKEIDHEVPTKKKRHSPRPSKVAFDKAGLLNEFKNLEPGSKINLSALARKFGIQEQYGNQVIREFLEENGFDLSKYSSNMMFKNKVRRAYNKIPGTYGVSTPMPRTLHKLKEEMKQKVNDGEILLGDLVAPKTYKKITIDTDGSIIEKEFTVAGRKLPMDEIRKMTYKEHAKAGILRQGGSKELKRNFITWGDHSPVLSYGFLLYTVKVIYSKEIFYTDTEMEKISGRPVDVQSLVESPSVYIFTNTTDSIADKLMFSESRVNDILSMRENIEMDNGDILHDQMRFFQGDHPELQFESGNSLGGNFPCNCGINVSDFNNITKCFNEGSIKSLEERRIQICQGPAGKKPNVSPFQKLKMEQIFQELEQRNIIYNKCWTKQDMENCLKENLKGNIRHPALTFGNQTTPLPSQNLQNYEVSPIEPLHDCKGHIKNVWSLLPSVLTPQLKKLFQETIECLHGQKEKVRGSDYRLSTIVIYQRMKEAKCPTEIMSLLYTLTEITRLCYAKAVDRSPKYILRLYNVTFQHASQCLEVFGKNPKLTSFYGVYFHSLVCHLPEMARIIAPSSLSTENEERMFSTFKQISLRTSSRTSDNIRDNGIVRLQMEKEFKQRATSKTQTSIDSKISKYAKPLSDTHPNTRFHVGEFSDNVLESHFKRIPDYLVQGEGVWWYKEGNYIVFKDGSKERDTRPEGPELKSYENVSIQKSAENVKVTWEKCKNIPLPINLSLIEDESQGQSEYSTQCEETQIPEIIVTDNTYHFKDNENTLTDQSTSASPTSQVPKVPNPFHTGNLRSSISKSICILIGMSEELKTFDKEHILYKEYKYESARVKCNNILPKLQKLVKERFNNAEIFFKKWQKEFFLANEYEPQKKDIESDVECHQQYLRIVHGKKLLKMWKL